MNVVRDVERRRADRLRLAYHIFCRAENSDIDRFDALEMGAEVLLDPSTIRQTSRHLIELGILKPHDEEGRLVSLTEYALGVFRRAERRPAHKKFGFGALLERGLQEGPLPAIGRIAEPEDAVREMWTLYWVYVLSGGDTSGAAKAADLRALVGLSEEVLSNVLLTLEMDNLLRFDPANETVSPAIAGVVLLETIVWCGTRSVAGYPSAASIGLIEANDLPRERR